MTQFTIHFSALFVSIAILSMCGLSMESKATKVYYGGMKMTPAEAAKHPKHPLKKMKNLRTGFVPPASFSASQKWPGCPSISTIRDQGACGDCWAVSTASVIADRLCIASGMSNTDFVSGSQVASCTYQTSRTPAGSCSGGVQADALSYAAQYGVASGGEYGSNVGCVPYSVSDYTENAAISCQLQCTNPSFATPLGVDNTRHQIDTYWVNYLPTPPAQSDIDSAVNLMQYEIYTNGPIAVSIDVYSDWNAASPQAPYSPGAGANITDGHALRLTGWGTNDAGVRYWIAANSWGPDSGPNNGYYYILMGSNVASIEQQVSAPIVNVPNNCQTASFCTSPIDQAITMDPNNTASATFLFQGNCLLEVNKQGGKISAIGAAVPFAKRIVYAVDGPITGYYYNDQGITLQNPTISSPNCVGAPGSTKYACLSLGAFTVAGTGGANPQAYQNKNGVITSYSYDGSWFYYSNVADPSTPAQGLSADTLNGSAMTQVKAFLDIDGTNMYVFGVDAGGKSLIGVMAYPTDPTQGSFTWVTQPGPAANFQSC